ncbi:MAG: TlpA disulfide reductase family protein [Bacilli bacterium]
MRNALIIGIVVVLGALAIYQNQSASSEPVEERPEIGFLAPSFVLTSLDGTEKVALSDLKGKPVFINFWASWCGPCKVEMPIIQEAYNKYKDDVHFVMLNIVQGDPIENVNAYLKENAFTFPIVRDNIIKENNMVSFEVSDKYQVISIPTTYFVDHNGIIAKKHPGIFTSIGQLETELVKLIKLANK